ncbi:hypothetical protein DEH84_16215 [Aquabacterium olei]|uniref:Sensor domain-containing diguanylate cyclase n=1 Tax=Aquabacterium olei TaxID=1296669 RepID=A0A2U8FV89_9BURK|nr:PAS domain S-box protein [Aquabacterium olei]AWI54787.1 hypothetical protein DEH84_16215 [Aquabacterium olei]
MALPPTSPPPRAPAGRATTLDGFAGFVCRQLQVPLSAVSLPQGKGQHLVCVVSAEHGPQTDDLSLDFPARPHPFAVADLRTEPAVATAWQHAPWLDVRACAAVPLRGDDGAVIGTLWALAQQPRAFTIEELGLLDNLAPLVASALHESDPTEQARLHRIIMDNAPVGIAVVSLEGRLRRFNPALCTLLGRPPEQLLQAHLQDLTPAQDAATELQLAQRLLDGEQDTFTIEKRYIRPDGSLVWGELNVALVRDKAHRPRHFVMVVEDITERHRAQAHLQELHAQLEERVAERTAELRAVLANAYDAYICMDASGAVVEWNRQAERTFGWQREEAIGRQLDELVVPPAHRGRHRRGMADMQDASIARVVDRRRELPAVRRDGTIFPCEVTVTTLQSATRGTLYAAFLHDISERQEAQKRLAESKRHLEDLYENAPCGYYSLDASGTFVDINRMAAEIYGETKEALLGRRSPREFFTEQGKARFAEVYPRFIREGQFGPEEFDLLAADGQTRRVSVMATALYDDQGQFLRSRTVIIDVTELHRTRQALQAANRQQHLMLDNEMVGIVKIASLRVTWANRAFEKLSGYELAELIGRNSAMLYADPTAFQRVSTEAYPIVHNGGIYRTQEQMLTRDGRRLWVDMSGTLLTADESESVWMMQDITAMKAYQEKVEEMAFHDALTGLPNRALLLDRLKQAIAGTARNGKHVAVCFGDLDGFKAVNDRHGHDAGDRLLCEVANRLQGVIRANDTAARLGGDEFVLVLTQLASPEEVHLILARARQVVAQPVALPGGQQAAVTISFGVAFAPDMGTDAHRLLDTADRAMYVAKGAFKSRQAQQQAGS